MKAALNSEWRTLFDLVTVECNSSLFMKTEYRFERTNDDKIFRQGSACHLKEIVGIDKKVAYFSDIDEPNSNNEFSTSPTINRALGLDSAKLDVES